MTKYEAQNTWKHAKAGMQNGEVWEGRQNEDNCNIYTIIKAQGVCFLVGNKWLTITDSKKKNFLERLLWTRCEKVEDASIEEMAQEALQEFREGKAEPMFECEHEWVYTGDCDRYEPKRYRHQCNKCKDYKLFDYEKKEAPQLTPEMLNKELDDCHNLFLEKLEKIKKQFQIINKGD